MKIVVAGGTGFIGRRLIGRLLLELLKRPGISQRKQGVKSARR